MAEAKEINKPWWQSRTIWFNVLYTMIEFISVWLDILPDKYIPYAIAFQGMFNVLLRMITNSGVDFSTKKK